MMRASLYGALPLALLVVICSSFLATPAGAGDPTPTLRFTDETTVTASTNEFTYQKLVKIVTELVKMALVVAELCVVIAIVYYGLRMVMSRGEPAKFTEAKKGLGYSVVGALIIFGVYTIIATVQGAVNSVGN